VKKLHLTQSVDDKRVATTSIINIENGKKSALLPLIRKNLYQFEWLLSRKVSENYVARQTAEMGRSLTDIHEYSAACSE